MSGELIDLLRAGTETPVRWRDLLVTNNVAAIPPVNETPGDFVWNRGFNVVVLNRLGRPRFFCKCRSAKDTKLAHEAASMDALHHVPELREYVPRVTQLESDRLRIMITPFLPGTPLNGVLDGPFRQRMTPVVRRAMEGVIRLAMHSTAALPRLVTADTVNVLHEVDPVLMYLTEVGLSPEAAAAFRTVVARAPELPRQLQHGDLWPANILQSRRHLWFIDFEMFGSVQVPLYDVFHFLRTCTDAWSSDKDHSWSDRMRADGPVSELVRDCAAAAAARLGLDSDQAIAALIYYVTHFSATTHRRNPAGAVWKTFFREVEALAEALGRGGQLSRLFLRAAA